MMDALGMIMGGLTIVLAIAFYVKDFIENRRRDG